MQQRTLKTQQRSLQQRLYTISSGKRPVNLTKKSNVRGMLPPIQAPLAKRLAAINQMNKDYQIHSDDELMKKQQKKKQNQRKRSRKKQAKKFCGFGLGFIGKLLQVNKSPSQVHQDKRSIKIAQILSFLYNQFPKPQKSHKNNLRVYNQWELLQIRQNYLDTNLGDFVIKIVNPDYLPKQYLKDKKYDDDKNAYISIFSALEIYDQLFNTQKGVDKYIESIEKQAFQLAFYLLDIQQGNIMPKYNFKSRLKMNNNQSQYQFDNQKNIPEHVQQFLTIFMYFTKIEDLNYSQYLQLKKKPQFKNIQLSFKSHEMVQNFHDFQQTMANSVKNQAQEYFSQYKKQVYQFLTKLLENQNKGLDNQFISTLLKRVTSISQLLKYFPNLTKKLFQALKEKIRIIPRDSQNKQDWQQQPSFRRKLHSGGYLTRVNFEGQLRWIQLKQRPTDVLTLLRKFLIYRLTRRGGLFIRSFLSRQQTHIFLIIKASQKHLQKKAQNSNFNMEIQLGSVDIFSFQPVDRYGRPLRCHKYLRQSHFIKKYNLFIDKRDKDQSLGDKSVQSQALNLYKKALKMNDDELRAKIIVDQQQSDELFDWVSSKTQTKYIKKDEILNNKYNKDEVQENIWPIYYIYNKLITEYLKKVRQQFTSQKNNKASLQALQNNIGLTLRLMFLKALNFCNQMYFHHRHSRFKFLKNFFIRKHPLQTIWNQMGQDSPRGYFPYFFSQKNQKIWRRYQINQQKDRSKFTPATRLIITNNIIRQFINITKSLIQHQLTDFYPIHDPFILKHIKIRPFLQVINSLIDNGQTIEHEDNKKNDTFKIQTYRNDTYIQYECDYTSEDFTKQSMKQKLRFNWRQMTSFSVNTVAFYCGEKLAFFFEFRRYLTQRAWPLSIITFIIQIIFWVQNSQIASTGTSTLTTFNNVLMIIMTVINIIWVQKTIKNWQNRQKSLARSFGTNDLQVTKSQKRVLFEGTMQRNLQTDDINDQEDNKIVKAIKTLIALLINIIFVVMMASLILLIIAMKIQMFQAGYSQTTVTVFPSILIGVSIQVLSYIYSHYIISALVNFQNKKTILQYEDSLTSKSFIVTFTVTYFVLFIYGFFQQYFQSQFVCSLKTSAGQEIKNCYYYMANQIVTDTVIDLIFTIIVGFLPYALFYIKQYRQERKEDNRVSYNLNYFESIDCFYQEQDKMENYMHSDEIDRTWEGYNQIIIAFTTLVLFAPIVPFLFLMMFLVGVVSLNAKKREIIYYSKRTLPIKVKTIGFWLTILKFISVLGVFVNIALIIYVRNAISDAKSIVFFSCVFIVLVIKYIFSFGSGDEDSVGKRCKARIAQLISQKNIINFTVKNQNINTDIENVFYNEIKLSRNLPVLKGANLKFK